METNFLNENLQTVIKKKTFDTNYNVHDKAYSKVYVPSVQSAKLNSTV